nr:tRNA pseudouridine(55) synthase TruB [Micromonospora sp. DSM 115978]
LVLGAGRGTRLLGHLTLTDKVYEATIRLGTTTTTDDADGEPVAHRPVEASPEAVAAAMSALTGAVMQVPSSVSAIKVGGVRSYARVRAGEAVELAARPVTVHRFELRARREVPDGHVDLDVTVACSSGTYVRALARDLGAALGCGGHLTALRRTSVGPFEVSAAVGLDTFGERGRAALLPLADAVAASFPSTVVDAERARDVSHGRRPPAVGLPGTYGVFAPDGAVLALAEDTGDLARLLVVFAPA